MFEATLIKVVGPEVELQTLDGKSMRVPKLKLSYGDQEYIRENSPPDKGSSLAPKPANEKIPVPAKAVKFDRKTVNREAGWFTIRTQNYRVCETPHFKVLYLKPADPTAMAELAERLWIDTAFFHGTFAPRWHDRKMAIIMVNDEEGYREVGDWVADMLMNAKQEEEARKVRITWPQTAAGFIRLPQEIAEKEALMTSSIVFRTWRQDSRGNQIQIKEVFDPFRTHCLSGQLLSIQIDGISGFGSSGALAFLKGHSYYKEISLTGRSDTAIVRVTNSGQVGSVSGYAVSTDWTPELKRRLRKGLVKPSLKSLYEATAENATEDIFALSYAFSRYLQSTPDRLTAFNRLCQRINTSSQIPVPDEVAKIYGLEDGDALEKDWIAWMDSNDFR